MYWILILYCVAVSEQYVVELSGLPYFWGNPVQPCSFPILIFLITESTPCLNGPSLMSNCLLIILVIGSCVIFGGFPSRFSKCCFHSFILYCWFAAFSFALAVFFLLLTSFIICQSTPKCTWICWRVLWCTPIQALVAKISKSFLNAHVASKHIKGSFKKINLKKYHVEIDFRTNIS